MQRRYAPRTAHWGVGGQGLKEKGRGVAASCDGGAQTVQCMTEGWADERRNDGRPINRRPGDCLQPPCRRPHHTPCKHCRSDKDHHGFVAWWCWALATAAGALAGRAHCLRGPFHRPLPHVHMCVDVYVPHVVHGEGSAFGTVWLLQTERLSVTLFSKAVQTSNAQRALCYCRMHPLHCATAGGQTSIKQQRRAVLKTTNKLPQPAVHSNRRRAPAGE